MSTAIIGAGLAGLAASHALRRQGVDATVFEARDHWGGHTYSDVVDGFTFDEGPHVSFTNDERVKSIFLEGAGSVESVPSRITNWFRGRWVTHPAQVHLYGLDPDLVTRCIADFVDAQHSVHKIENYADWLIAMYGRTFAEEFPFRYTRKYWTVDPHELGVDWVGKRMYPPKLEEVLKGAVAPSNEGEFHYLKEYRYPRSGGYQAFVRAFAEGADIRLGKRVVAVDVAAKSIGFSDGSDSSYDTIVSTMPLDGLVACIRGVPVPDGVGDAAQELLCSSVVLVDLGVDRFELFDHQWLYVYDEDISMSRVHFPHMFAPRNVPPGCGSIQAEVYFSPARPLETPAEQLPERVIGELARMGILRDAAEVRFARHRTLSYANVVFDHRRRPALEVILPFIEECGIVLAGRYGEWGYHWTDDAVRAGWRAAEQVTGIAADEVRREMA